MPFTGEDRYTEALSRAEGHESNAAMVRVDDLRCALNEIARLRDTLSVIAGRDWGCGCECCVRSAEIAREGGAI